MTSHDREFMNRVVGRVIEIDGGELTSYSGDYDFYEAQRAQGEVQAEAAYQRQQAKLAKEMRFIERFKAQAAKAAQVQSRVKQLDKIEKLEPPKRRSTLVFDFPPCPRSGDDVVKLDGVRKALRHQGDLRRPRPDHPPRRALGGDGRQRRRQVDAAQAGRRRERARRRDASRSAPASSSATSPSTPWRCWSRGAPSCRRSRTPSRSPTAVPCARWPAASASPATTSTSPAASCRAARRRASCIARILYDRPNFLVLDEPTNHLDMATKEMLVRALADYEGTMLFVSHDRRFLAHLSNRVLELDRRRAGTLRRRLPGIRRRQRARGAGAALSGGDSLFAVISLQRPGSTPPAAQSVSSVSGVTIPAIVSSPSVTYRWRSVTASAKAMRRSRRAANAASKVRSTA